MNKVLIRDRQPEAFNYLHMFSDVGKERLVSLMQDSNFLALRALTVLAPIIEHVEPKNEKDVTVYSALRALYGPAYKVLYQSLHDAQWNDTEISAGLMVAEGKLFIED